MRLPQRVPWACISELEQICSWIYADEEDLEAKTLAINRLSAWRAVTPLPHALDSALAILAARMLDASHRDPPSTRLALSLRQTYAAAIIRMVNGLVDPLQSGVYARSIAAIATQIGLPSWLVELRHAATHEDLPSLELLREACRESLSWLLHNYFHPTLNPSVPTSTSTSSSSLRPIAPLLRSYKLLMKAVTRDGSLRKRYQEKIDSVMHDFEHWITEAQVSSELAAYPLGSGFDDDSAAARIDIKEKWALETICNALLARGAIVPVSSRKCRAPADTFLPTTASLALWSPLLVQLHATHATFPSIFISQVISVLLSDLTRPDTDTNTMQTDFESVRRDTIHSEYLARWVTWVARTWTDSSEYGTDLRREVILQVAPIFIPGLDPGRNAKILNRLLQAISVGSKDLEECVEFLGSTIQAIPTQPWKAHDLMNMNERLQKLMTNDLQTSALHGSTARNGATIPGVSAAGWKLLNDLSNWAPCPIGVYYLNPTSSST